MSGGRKTSRQGPHDFHFDFSKDGPVSVRVDLSSATQALLALAPDEISNESARRRSLVALRAAVGVMEDLPRPEWAELASPLRALVQELTKLEDGYAPGDITKPRKLGHRPRDNAATVERQARAVLALKLLTPHHKTRRAAAERLSDAGFGSSGETIENLAANFKKDARRAAMLAEATAELIAAAQAQLGKKVGDLSAAQIIRVLHPSAV